MFFYKGRVDIYMAQILQNNLYNFSTKSTDEWQQKLLTSSTVKVADKTFRLKVCSVHLWGAKCNLLIRPVFFIYMVEIHETYEFKLQILVQPLGQSIGQHTREQSTE